MENSMNNSGNVPEKPNQDASQQLPSLILNLYRRLPFGRKHLFGHDNADQAAEYFVVNPVPHKHHSSWRPIFYRGDNPKYSGPEYNSSPSIPVGRALRTKMWNSFHIQMGDGVREVLENKARIKKRRRHERKQKLRKFFCMGEKPPAEPLEDPQEVQGLVAVFEMKRGKFLGRTLTWQLGGQRYQWKGTRRFSKGPFKGMKGMSHSFKLVDANNNIIATFEKDRWASYKRSERLGGPPNKKRQLLGTLRRFPPAADAPSPAAVLEAVRAGIQNGENASKLPEKLTKYLNLQGSHSGDLTEEAIAFTCWIAVEAEHRLRYKIFDLIEEVLENMGGA
ncbi:hypothetical protein P885DRAFT_80580 [Corynascus similis CBS 632.67]